jgi:anti-sigma factor RsiW
VSDHVDDLALSRLIDGDLPTLTHEAVLDHLLHCPACAARHEQLVDVAATLRGLPGLGWDAHRTAAVVSAIGERRPEGSAPGALVPAVIGVAVSAVVVGVAVSLGAFSLPATALGLSLQLTSALVSLRVFAAVSELLLVVLLIALAAPLAAYPLARWR